MMFDEMLHSTVPVSFSACHKQKTSLRAQITNTMRFTSPVMMVVKVLMVVAVIHVMHTHLFPAAYYRTALNTSINNILPHSQGQDVWQQISVAGNNV